MTRDEAMAVLCSAADDWATEVVEYIIPDGQLEDEDLAAKVAEVNRINEALVMLGGEAYAGYTTVHTVEDFE